MFVARMALIQPIFYPKLFSTFKKPQDTVRDQVVGYLDKHTETGFWRREREGSLLLINSLQIIICSLKVRWPELPPASFPLAVQPCEQLHPPCQTAPYNGFCYTTSRPGGIPLMPLAACPCLPEPCHTRNVRMAGALRDALKCSILLSPHPSLRGQLKVRPSSHVHWHVSDSAAARSEIPASLPYIFSGGTAPDPIGNAFRHRPLLIAPPL